MFLYIFDRILLVHGHWFYVRTATLVQYFFYKNLAGFTAQLLFACFNSFSTQPVYDTINLTMFNILFTYRKWRNSKRTIISPITMMFYIKIKLGVMFIRCIGHWKAVTPHVVFFNLNDIHDVWVISLMLMWINRRNSKVYRSNNNRWMEWSVNVYTLYLLFTL